jgi:hypothetical protein
MHAKSWEIYMSARKYFYTLTHECGCFRHHLFLHIRAHCGRWKYFLSLLFLSESKSTINGDGNTHTYGWVGVQNLWVPTFLFFSSNSFFSLMFFLPGTERCRQIGRLPPIPRPSRSLSRSPPGGASINSRLSSKYAWISAQFLGNLTESQAAARRINDKEGGLPS